jgi:3-dehydroquinate synthase
MALIDALGYPIVVDSGALDRLTALVREHARAHRYAVVTDENVAPHYLGRVRDALASVGGADRVHEVVIPSGERHKTREQWASITDALLALGCGRDTVVVALGGGVVGDLAGFVAATYMRGVPVVQIPTTLLAMVDASVGGKTAVDTPAGKNTVGAFHPPALVIIDPCTLASLPARELRAGLAEVIKHGVIADRDELNRAASLGSALASAEATTADRKLDSLIARSVRIKAAVVAADERELGLRKVLNFGHTVGHGVEAASDYTLLHGEAVAIGMVAESRLAERAAIAETGTATAIERAVSAAGLPTRLPPGTEPIRVLELMQSDKKRRQGALEYALPLRIGAMAGESSGWAIPIPNAQVETVLREMAR